MGLTKPRAAQIFNLDYKQATRVVTTVSVTLSGGAPSSVDGVSLTTGDRVLVTAQTTGSQNGLYYVTTVGSGSNGTWARTSDGNDTGEIEAGMIVMVTEGTIYADTQWKLITDDPIVINTTALTFTQNYSANSISGGSSNVRVFSNANVTISSAGTANVLTISSTGTVVSGTELVSGNITGGNLLTGGLISATSNITGANLVVPGNGYLDITGPAAQVYTARVRGSTGGAQFGIATSNTASFGIANDSLNAAGTDYANLTYSANTLVLKTGNVNTLSNRLVIDSTGIVSVVGNITSGNILTGGLISATGNITGNYFLGNVFYANGITASKIYNGTSEANVGTSGGNANISIGGTSNVVVFASTGEYVTGLLSVSGNVTSANINTVGNVSATGNIAGNYLLANIYYATGFSASRIFNGTSEANIGTSGGNANISIGGTSNVVVFSTAGEYVTGLLSVTGNIAGGNVSATNLTGTNVSVTGTATAASTVGGVITGSSASVTGTVTAASTVGGVITGSSLSASGNVTGGNANITGTTAATSKTTGALIVGGGVGVAGDVWAGNSITVDNGSYGNVVITQFASVFATGVGSNPRSIMQVRGADNVAGIGIQGASSSNGQIYANTGIIFTTGVTLRDKDFPTGGTTRATIDSTGLSVTGIISATGNVTGGNIVATTAITNGNITITGANIVSTGPTLYIDPNGSGGIDGNVIIAGNLSVQGNVTYINSNNVTTNDLTINVANNASTASQANGGGIGVGPAGSEYISLTYNSTSNIWVASNGLTSQGILSATGNVTGGNILTAGLISATGNITGNYHIGNGSQLTGINAFSNVAVANGNSILANSISSTLKLTAGSGITLVATPGTGEITIATSSGGNSIFATGGDMGTVTETVTASEDLGSVTEAVTVSYDLGSVVSASGLIYPSQLILPAYTPATLPGASPAAQFVYLSTSSIGAMTAFSDGTNWRFTSSGNVVS